jgi:hypothetical protein
LLQPESSLTNTFILDVSRATPTRPHPTGMPDFSWSKHTKNRKNLPNYRQTIPNGHKLYKNGRKIFQMVIKYNNMFHSKALQILPKSGILI